MKKFLLLILTLICSISLAACYSNKSTKESKEEPTSQEESVLESVVESEESLSEEESVSEAESEESVSEAESEESVSEPESEESASEAESESESVEVTYTITFVVVTNMPNVTAPEALVVKEGDVVTLPTYVGEYKVECWTNQATGEVFVGGEFTLCEDVVLVAEISSEYGPY